MNGYSLFGTIVAHVQYKNQADGLRIDGLDISNPTALMDLSTGSHTGGALRPLRLKKTVLPQRAQRIRKCHKVPFHSVSNIVFQVPLALQMPQA